MRKLRAWMTLTGCSQSELARRMNLTQPTIWAWINGRAMPTIDNIRRLSTLTGLSVEALLETDDEAA